MKECQRVYSKGDENEIKIYCEEFTGNEAIVQIHTKSVFTHKDGSKMSMDGEKGRKTTTTALINLPLGDVPEAFVTKVI